MPQAFSNMMTPVLALVVWTLVILVWLYARRIPAMRKAGIDPAKIKGSESYASMPPMDPKAVWVADNYNHLHEQPMIFYALCVYSHLVGQTDALNVGLAWAYVAHSRGAQPHPDHDELRAFAFRGVQHRLAGAGDPRDPERAGAVRDLAI